MTDRPTIRPVTLSRLVEVTHLASAGSFTTETVESRLDTTRSRARETTLEARRLGLIEETSQSSTPDDGADQPQYEITSIGEDFMTAVQAESWTAVSDLLRAQSPHYDAYLAVLETADGALTPDAVLTRLEAASETRPVSFNQTGVDVIGDWAERLGAVQRNAFSGEYYPVTERTPPEEFCDVLLAVIDDREEEAGVNLRQRYLSIPELREYTCQRLRCTRSAFNTGLTTLAADNVGAVELSGAPIDTGAKGATFGIKRIQLADGEELVSTTQSTDDVMAGVEQHDKQYYYLAVHDRELTFAP